MPPLPSPGKVIKCVTQFTDTNGHNYEVIDHVAYTGTATSAGVAAVAGDVSAAYGAHWMNPAVVDPAMTITYTTATDLSSDTGPYGSHYSGDTGGGPGEAIASTACVISYVIDRRYRGGKPRRYLPGAAASLITGDNTWEAAVVTAAEATAAALIGLNAVRDELTEVGIVNVSYFKGFTVVTSPITGRAKNVPTVRAVPVVDTIYGSLVNARVRSQRRRLRPSAAL